MVRAFGYWERLRAETFLIVGLGVGTGVHAARLFDRFRVPYRISDAKGRDSLRPSLAGLSVSPQHVFAGPQAPSQLDGVTRLLVSPGIPRTLPLIREASRRGIPMMSDIDLTADLIGDKPVIAITGTDGKTTTTSLVGALVSQQCSALVCGNIGTSPLAYYDELLASDWVVLELSSFMLEEAPRLRPRISTVLNVAQDHVDRHRTPSDYLRAKCNVFRHCGRGDVFVKNLDAPALSALPEGELTVRTVSKVSPPEGGKRADFAFVDGRFHFPRGYSFSYQDCLLRGVQNVTNILTASAIATEVGLSPEHIFATVRAFEGLRHRMQHLGCLKGVDVFDDSKASNVHAVDAALQNFPRRVVLILGGRDKGLDFSPLRRHAPRLKLTVCYGESGRDIGATLGFSPQAYAYRFEEAVRLAVNHCLPGDTLLLSPGCTSWDQFANYEERGDAFQELIGCLLG